MLSRLGGADLRFCAHPVTLIACAFQTLQKCAAVRNRGARIQERLFTFCQRVLVMPVDIVPDGTQMSRFGACSCKDEAPFLPKFDVGLKVGTGKLKCLSQGDCVIVAGGFQIMRPADFSEPVDKINPIGRHLRFFLLRTSERLCSSEVDFH